MESPFQLTIREARFTLSPAEFRRALRQHLLDHPDLTLREVATMLGVTRQRAGALAGRLDRPSPGPRRALRVRNVRANHGTKERAQTGCNCWRCRRAAEIVIPRGRRVDERTQQVVLDWLAWTDPDEDTSLTQTEIGKLTGVRQTAVSRIFRAQT